MYIVCKDQYQCMKHFVWLSTPVPVTDLMSSPTYMYLDPPVGGRCRAHCRCCLGRSHFGSFAIYKTQDMWTMDEWLIALNIYSRSVHCTVEWVGEWVVSFTSSLTHIRSFQRQVFLGNHLHWYWQLKQTWENTPKKHKINKLAPGKKRNPQSWLELNLTTTRR